MQIQAEHMSYEELNQQIQTCEEDEIQITHCLGQRYIGNGLRDKKIKIYGTPGNIVGGFLDGGEIEVFGNVQEGCGNTMNKGRIIVHGRCGDALAYGMRGGEIFIQGDAGSRCAIHMKEYQASKPVVIIGGCAKDFLAEYLSGGMVIVLNLGHKENCVGRYCGIGAHGGNIYLRMDDGAALPQTAGTLSAVDEVEQEEIVKQLQIYDTYMHIGMDTLLQGTFYKIVMQEKNPYEGLYVDN